MHKKSLFIAFEGVDGVGKTYLIDFIRDFCRPYWTYTSEPYDPENFVGETDAAKFYHDRVKHVTDVIRPALARGETMVTDRYYASQSAYQDDGDPTHHGVFAHHARLFPKPDLWVYMFARRGVLDCRGKATGHDACTSPKRQHVVFSYHRLTQCGGMRPYLLLDGARSRAHNAQRVIDAADCIIEARRLGLEF